MVDIPDVVTYTNFGVHRLRGFWVAGGQISPSPIDSHRRPYNTLALLCERVIYNDVRLTERTLLGVLKARQRPVFLSFITNNNSDIYTVKVRLGLHCIYRKTAL